MSELNTLGLKHGTDKSSKGHRYLDLYEKYLAPLRKLPIDFFEIGVSKGNSTHMWNEYFVHSKTRLFGLDNVDRIKIKPDRFKLFIGLQEDRETLSELVRQTGPFDVIIDDGGHYMIQQQTSLGVLFPWVKPGGLYIIEDLHTSYFTAKSRFNATKTVKTTLRMLQNLRATGKIDSDFILASEAQYLEANLSSCVIEKGREEICFIRKK